jgi:hypothetical protein
MLDVGYWMLDHPTSQHPIEIVMRTNIVIRTLQFAICILQFAICNFSTVVGTCRAENSNDPKHWIAENTQPLIELYRELHQTPELSLHEEQTAARMAKELRDVGATVTTGVGGHGVVGVL